MKKIIVAGLALSLCACALPSKEKRRIPPIPKLPDMCQIGIEPDQRKTKLPSGHRFFKKRNFLRGWVQFAFKLNDNGSFKELKVIDYYPNPNIIEHGRLFTKNVVWKIPNNHQPDNIYCFTHEFHG